MTEPVQIIDRRTIRPDNLAAICDEVAARERQRAEDAATLVRLDAARRQQANIARAREWLPDHQLSCYLTAVASEDGDVTLPAVSVREIIQELLDYRISAAYSQ